MRLLFWARVVTGGLIEGCDSEGNAQGLSKWISSNPIMLGIPTTSFKHWTLYSQRNLQLPQNPWRGRVRRGKCPSMPFPSLASPPRYLYLTCVSPSAFLTQTEQEGEEILLPPIPSLQIHPLILPWSLQWILRASESSDQILSLRLLHFKVTQDRELTREIGALVHFSC